MCRTATIRAVTAASFLAVLPGLGWSQALSLDWRHIGNSAIELALPSVATGAVDRVWFSQDGSTLYARTPSGRTFRTSDFEGWQPVTNPKIAPPEQENPVVGHLPESGLKISAQAPGSHRYYGVGRQAYRSDDGGITWANLTAYQGASILGDALTDVAVSPGDPDEVVVASLHGVWRSLDGGQSWTGLNEFLPNLPSSRLLNVPTGTRGVLLSLRNANFAVEWAPGEKTAWRPVESADLQREQNLKAALSQVVNRTVTAFTPAREYIYVGDSEGRLQVSSDAGISWGTAFRLGDAGAVEAIWVDPADPRVAIAVLRGRNTALASQPKSPYVIRTMNGGVFWDDITADLPEGAAAHGVTADRATGTIYIATDAGVFYTATDLASAGSATSWSTLGDNLPAAPASDVKLDGSSNQIYVALDGYGVYAAIAPHRLRAARLVSAADYSSRPAAPGALLSVLGEHVDSARSDNTVVPVLDASTSASQIQVPFEAKGNTFSVSVDGTAGRLTFGLPLQSVSPGLVVDPEGTPLIMDAASGVLLDATKPAHPNTRIQILATGFGRVTPDWPTGLAAPLSDSPRVAVPVHAYLDGAPVDVTLASLAPGYVGFYLIEVQLPRIVNRGPAELFLEAEGQQTNRVRLYLEP